MKLFRRMLFLESTDNEVNKPAQGVPLERDFWILLIVG